MKKETWIQSKARMQQAFMERCKRDELTPQQIVDRASFFPKEAELRVVAWPKL